MTEDNEQALTLFEAVTTKDREKALQSLIEGKTPISEIKTRPMRGGGEAKYVNTYYMTRQIALITGFRWSSECLREEFYPNRENPREVGTLMKVTIWDNEGNQYSHQSWGQKDIARYTKDGANYKAGDPMAIFDDLKAAYSDGIKKCLSYFGIANDIYGGKEMEYFSDDSEVELDTKDAYKAFAEFLGKHKIRPSEVCEVMGLEQFAQITDYKEAYKILQSWLKSGKPRGEELVAWRGQLSKKEEL